jgi:diguanylate cyclase (GGDEF)-like protein
MTPAFKELRRCLSETHPLLDVDNNEEAVRLVDKLHDHISAVLFCIENEKKAGFELLKKMNDDKRFVDIPTIAVADREGSDDFKAALAAGANEYFEPPFKKELISLRIKNAIRSKDSATFSEVEKILRALPSNIYLKDAEGKYVFATHYWHHLNTEDNPTWTIRGKTDMEIRGDKENARKAMETDMEVLRTGKGVNYIVEEKNGPSREFLELIKRPTFDESGKVNGVVAIINNITEMQLLRLELEKRSKTDQLTGLLNKQTTEELITDLIKDESRLNRKGALLMIDVDNFKHVNDTFGHIAGDRVLMAIGNIIHDSFKGMDVAGRIGGDEFMVYLQDIDSSDMALRLAASISEKAHQLFPNEPLGKCVSLSIGIALYPDHSNNFEDLYRAADKALYYVKERGRDFYKMYAPHLDELATEP